jgi:hypothetical protein
MHSGASSELGLRLRRHGGGAREAQPKFIELDAAPTFSHAREPEQELCV